MILATFLRFVCFVAGCGLGETGKCFILLTKIIQYEKMNLVRLLAKTAGKRIRESQNPAIKANRGESAGRKALALYPRGMDEELPKGLGPAVWPWHFLPRGAGGKHGLGSRSNADS